MLCLSRKKNERICIGRDIEVVVVDIRGDKVRLGVRAPADVSVHRAEVYQAILHESQGRDITESGQDGSRNELATIAYLKQQVATLEESNKRLQDQVTALQGTQQ